MSTALFLNEVLSSQIGTPQGTSSSAKFIENQLLESNKRLQASYLLGMEGKGVIDELEEILVDYSDENWDGNRSYPASIESYYLTIKFLHLLPYGCDSPSVGLDPDGQITLDWYRNPRWTLSVSVDPARKLHYAALFGPNKVYGTEVFLNIVPKNILDLIYKVTSI